VAEGPGATEVDWLSVIQDWVEHGKAPEKNSSAPNMNKEKTVMTRPGLSLSASTRFIKEAAIPASAESF